MIFNKLLCLLLLLLLVDDLLGVKENFLESKIEEYGNLKQFKTAKEKLEWIKKNIEEITGQSWDTIISMQDLSNVSKLTRQKIMRIDERIVEYMYQIMNNFDLSKQHDEVQEAINTMEEEILNEAQFDNDVLEAAQYAIEAAKFTIKLFTEDEAGNTSMDRIMAAIVNNTEDTLDEWNRARNSKGKQNCGSKFYGGIVGGATGGCALGQLVGTASVIGIAAGCPAGAFLGAVRGLVTGIYICMVEAFGCFSTKSTVETPGGLKEIFKLEIGDYVKTSSGGDELYFTEFLGWMDRHQSQPSKMLSIWTSSGQVPLTLSESHIVFTPNTGTKYARDIQPGNYLLRWNGTDMEEVVVEAITPTISVGYWAPLTRSGHLLVDGYLTSCYASFPHQIADIAMAPVKAMPRTLLDDHKSQHNDGVRKVIKFIKDIGTFLGARNANRFPEISPLKFDSSVEFLSIKSEF